MKKLLFNYMCFMGYYNFELDINGSEATLSVKTLNFGENKEENVDLKKIKKISELIEEADIYDWDESYIPGSDELMMTDVPGFKVCIIDDDGRIYYSSGQIGCEPEEYSLLIEAMKVCDENAAKTYK